MSGRAAVRDVATCARSLWARVLMRTGHKAALVLGEFTLGTISAIAPLAGLGLMVVAGGGARWLLRGAAGGRRAPRRPIITRAA